MIDGSSKLTCVFKKAEQISIDLDIFRSLFLTTLSTDEVTNELSSKYVF